MHAVQYDVRVCDFEIQISLAWMKLSLSFSFNVLLLYSTYLNQRLLLKSSAFFPKTLNAQCNALVILDCH